MPSSEQQGHVVIEKIINSGNCLEEYGVGLSVREEVERLSEAGLDVALVATPDRHSLPPEEQSRINAEIEYVESNPEARQHLKEQLAYNEGLTRWAKVGNGAAIGLFPAYAGPEVPTLGYGISPDAYDVGLFLVREADENGQELKKLISACEMAIVDAEKHAIAQGKPVPDARENAMKTSEAYKRFLNTPYNSNQVLRDFLGGSMDGRAVRTRAYAAISMAEQHFKQEGELEGRKLTSASLACGAAQPVYEMVSRIEAAGADVEKIILADQDPMALASAHSLAETSGLSDKIDIRKINLLNTELTEHIEPDSVDVVDILGLFEYIPELKNKKGDVAKGRDYATQLLTRAKEIVKPGGIILFGNMLPERPQENFFYDVLQWPKLYQRSIEDTLDIVDRAGLNADQTKVRVPAKEGVYAVYAVPVDAETDERGLRVLPAPFDPPSRSQRAL